MIEMNTYCIQRIIKILHNKTTNIQFQQVNGEGEHRPSRDHDDKKTTNTASCKAKSRNRRRRDRTNALRHVRKRKASGGNTEDRKLYAKCSTTQEKHAEEANTIDDEKTTIARRNGTTSKQKLRLKEPDGAEQAAR